MANDGIAEIFLEIADLLDLEGVKFKPEAYRRAARTLQGLPEEVASLVRTGKIDEVPGIGEALSEKVREYVSTGQVHYLAKLREQWPPGLLELMRLEGIGPKTTRRFFLEFQVQGPQDLQRLLDRGGLQGVAGFGERKIVLLTQALAKARASPAGSKGGFRLPLPEAQARADELLESLRTSGAPLERLVFAGSLRRRKETVGDLDLLATSSDPREVMRRFTTLAPVREVKLSGDTKSTVVLEEGLQVDLRVVAPEAFGAALQYFTGSKDHNVRLRSLANKRGLSINEYGLTREGKLVQAPTEEEVYAAVGVPWIPPECREDQGEIDAAQSGKLPVVVQDNDLRGELHIHMPASLGPDDVAPWAEALKERGWSYGGFVVRREDLRAQGLTMSEVRQQLPRALLGVAVLLGLEQPWEGTGPASEEERGADFLVWRPPEKPAKELARLREALSASKVPLPGYLAHLAPEELAAAGWTWSDLVAPGPEGVPVEVAVTHELVVTETARVREARESGVPLVLSGRPRLPEELARTDLAAGLARRAWVAASQVVNASKTAPFAALPEAEAPVGGRSSRGKPRRSPR